MQIVYCEGNEKNWTRQREKENKVGCEKGGSEKLIWKDIENKRTKKTGNVNIMRRREKKWEGDADVMERQNKKK